MGVIQDSELVLYKAISEYINKGLVKPLKELNSRCMTEFLKFEKFKSKFMNCETYEDLGDSSKGLKAKQTELLSILAIQDRLERIVKRNEQRIAFAVSRFEQMGIYNDAVDKKTLLSTISAEEKNVSEESLNLNPRAKGGVTFKYFSGEILAFRDNELDFDLDENRDVLLNASSDFLHEVVATFPASVGTIPDEYYLVSSIKNKVLKECILYVASKIKTQTMIESNAQLGGLLENVAEISSFSQYANELKNYFNVVVKQCIKSQAPDLAEDAEELLACNEGSFFLPRQRRVAGARKPVPKAEEIKETTETENSKESSENVNSETLLAEGGVAATKEQLLDMLLNDDDDAFADSTEEPGEKDTPRTLVDDIPKVETDIEPDIDDDIEKTIRELEELLKDETDDEEDT